MTTRISQVTARISAIEAQLNQLNAQRRDTLALGAVNTLSSNAAGGTQSFDDTLSTALSDDGTTGATNGPQSPERTPADLRTPGSYGRLTPPAELAIYPNGQIPASALGEIEGTNHRLWAPAADAFELMRADAARAGVTIGITDSYRPLHVQERLAEEKGLYSQGGLAAVPGTSNHGWGMALDLDLDSAALEWMRENGHEYGFVEDVPREPWHWTYRPAA